MVYEIDFIGSYQMLLHSRLQILSLCHVVLHLTPFLLAAAWLAAGSLISFQAVPGPVPGCVLSSGVGILHLPSSLGTAKGKRGEL